MDLEKILETLKDIIEYVLMDDKEEDDFKENPDRSHIYYKCTLISEGIKQAEKELKEAIGKIKEDKKEDLSDFDIPF